MLKLFVIFKSKKGGSVQHHKMPDRRAENIRNGTVSSFRIFVYFIFPGNSGLHQLLSDYTISHEKPL